METRETLDPATRRRFRTGRACLDFSHTGGEGEFARWELLHEPADAARWMALVIGVDAVEVRHRDLAAVRELRAAITRAARGLAAGAAALDPVDVATINAAAMAEPLAPALSTDGTVATLQSGMAQQALSTLARDAVDLFGSPLRDRIRVCASVNCGLLFVDQSRPGRRRWCSMERCGDVAKKQKARG